MPAKYELKKTADGQLMWNLKASNGEVILTSDAYVSKEAATAGIASVRVNAPLDKRYERRTATNGSPYFALKGANGQTVGKSELYSGSVAMHIGITSIKNNAQTDAVDDQT